MTERTGGGEGGSHVIRILGGGVVFDVAAIAIGGDAQELIVDMASDAGQGGMRANQREAETRMIEPVHVDGQPDIDAVALSAGDGESRGAMIDGLSAVIVGHVARAALNGQTGILARRRAPVASLAVHGSMAAGELEARRVLADRFRRQLPPFDRVA